MLCGELKNTSMMARNLILYSLTQVLMEIKVFFLFSCFIPRQAFLESTFNDFTSLFLFVSIGFPGEVNVTVTYKLDKENELSVVMEAKPKDKATPINLAHHSYWNLGGHNAGDILSEEIQILGSSYTPVDGELIPTGEISPVKGTSYDFLQLRPIKDNMKDLKAG